MEQTSTMSDVLFDETVYILHATIPILTALWNGMYCILGNLKKQDSSLNAKYSLL